MSAGAPVHYRVCQAMLRGAGRWIWRVEALGRETIPREGPLIIAPTHESAIDPPLVGAYVPRFLRFFARRTLFVATKDGVERRRPIATRIGRAFGVIEVDLAGGGRDAVRKSLEVLAAGGAVLIFPEGTRSLDGQVKNFEAGVGLLALRSGAAVVPVSVDGTRRVWPKGRKRPRLGPGPVRLVYGAPVRYERPLKPEEVAADLRRRILALRGVGRPDGARDGASSRGEAGGGSST